MIQVQVQDRIEMFVYQVNLMLEKAFRESRIKTLVEVEYTSDKWAKLLSSSIVDGTTERGHSVYGFICLRDFTTKTLGTLRAGDIHKPASWKSPAKHARGNVFNDDCITCAGPFGLSYLRG